MVSSVYSAKGGGTKHLQKCCKGLSQILPSITPLSHARMNLPEPGHFKGMVTFIPCGQFFVKKKMRQRIKLKTAIKMPM
jgi:hypothetical protein